MNASTPLNYQPVLVMGGFGIEAIPSKEWRVALSKGEPVAYRHEVSGSALVTCEDGRTRSVQIELSLFGKKRHSALGGLVCAWHARPSRGTTHAQCKTLELTGGSVAFDGPIVFTESDIVTPTGAVSPELGLVYKADLQKGKTLQLLDVELRPKLDATTKLPVIGKDGTAYYVVSHKSGEAVVDRPKSVEIDDGDEAVVSAEPVSMRAAARKTGGNTAASDSAFDGPV